MSNLWERFNNIANTDEVNNAENSFTPIEAGRYKATLETLEAGLSKAQQLPILKASFRLDNGRCAFYNQLLQNINRPENTPIAIASAMNFLSKLKGEKIEYNGMGALADEIGAIPTGETYDIQISYGDKDTEHKYPRYTIYGKVVPQETVSEDIPF